MDDFFSSLAKGAFMAAVAVVSGTSAVGVAIGGIAVSNGLRMRTTQNASSEYLEQAQQSLSAGGLTMAISTVTLAVISTGVISALSNNNNFKAPKP